MSIQVKKADGNLESFEVKKLDRSLRKAGATRSEVSEIVSEIESIIYDGITTQEIYRYAFDFLRNSEQPAAARYSLRRALFGLGPTGFPFEDFLARLLESEGYTTQTRVTLQGKCVEHELDVAAYKSDHSFVVEAKFHSRTGVKSDLQVAIYSYARFLDLQETKIRAKDSCGINGLKVVTNTKFTTTAESYAACSGLELLSWDYPKNNNLQDRIQKAGLYPITVLQGLSLSQKRSLIEHGAIVCKDIINKPQILRHAHISVKRTESVLAEAKNLCS